MIKLPLDYNRGNYYVELKSKKKLRLLLDTGSNGTRISGRSINKCLYVETGEHTPVSGVWECLPATDICLVLSTTDGSYSKNLVASVIYDECFIGRMKLLSHSVDGLLGMDFLENCVIDIPNRLLTIIDEP